MSDPFEKDWSCERKVFHVVDEVKADHPTNLGCPDQPLGVRTVGQLIEGRDS